MPLFPVFSPPWFTAHQTKGSRSDLPYPGQVCCAEDGGYVHKVKHLFSVPSFTPALPHAKPDGYSAQTFFSFQLSDSGGVSFFFLY